jgi:hypothetical protein
MEALILQTTCKGYAPEGAGVRRVSYWIDCVEELQTQGYKYYLEAQPGRRITSGDLQYEYRTGTTNFFFKEPVPTIEQLRATVAPRFIPRLLGAKVPAAICLQYRKYYSEMSSVGRGFFAGTFHYPMIAEWIDFFEATLTMGTVEELIADFYKKTQPAP